MLFTLAQRCLHLCQGLTRLIKLFRCQVRICQRLEQDSPFRLCGDRPVHQITYCGHNIDQSAGPFQFEALLNAGAVKDLQLLQLADTPFRAGQMGAVLAAEFGIDGVDHVANPVSVQAQYAGVLLGKRQ